MSRSNSQRGDRKRERKQNRQHVKDYRRHKHNPCPHGPRQLDSTTELFGEFKRHSGGKRHNHWEADLHWNEVNTDSDGLPIIVKSYKVRMEYSADGIDWFLHQRRSVPSKKDFDDNELVHTIFKNLHGKLAYRYEVKPIGKDCDGLTSGFFDLGTPNDVPPAPHDVEIKRRSHGVRVHWRAPHHQPDEGDDPTEWPKTFGPPDDTAFHQDIAYFIAELWNNPDFGPVLDFTADASSDELTVTAHGFADGDPIMLSNSDDAESMPEGARPWRVYFVRDSTTNTFKLAKESDGSVVNLTSDGDGKVHWGMVRHARHVHHHHHVFRIDADDFDEDQKYYSRVCSVSDHRSKSAFVPATKDGNDDPEATPEGVKPAWHRRVFTFSIPGPVTATTYRIAERVDDDYIVRRVTTAFGQSGAGGPTKFDIKVNGGTFVFDGDTTKMTSVPAGDRDGSSRDVVNRDLDRGDHIRVLCEEVSATPPEDATIQVICDRVKRDDTTDSGGGGGDAGPGNNDNFVDAFVLPIDASVIAGSIVGATKEEGEPDHHGNAGGHSVWYVMTLPEDHPVGGASNFYLECDTTSGSTNPPLLAVYTGADVASLTEVVPDSYNTGSFGPDNYAQEVYSFLATGTYYVAVDGQDGETFDFNIYMFEF